MEIFNYLSVEERYGVPPGGDWLDYIKPASVIPDLDFRLRIAGDIAAMQEQIEELTRQRDSARGYLRDLRAAVYTGWEGAGRYLSEEVSAEEMAVILGVAVRNQNAELQALQCRLKEQGYMLSAMTEFVQKISRYRMPKTSQVKNPTLESLTWFINWAKEAQDLLATYVETEEAA